MLRDARLCFTLPSLYRQGNVGRADLCETDILQLLRLEPHTDESLLSQLRPHVISTDLNALAGVLSDLRRRLAAPNRFH